MSSIFSASNPIVAQQYLATQAAPQSQFSTLSNNTYQTPNYGIINQAQIQANGGIGTPQNGIVSYTPHGSVVYSGISPGAYTTAAQAQYGAINQGINAVNTYANPGSNTFNAPAYTTTVNAPDTVDPSMAMYNSAAANFTPISANINNLINQYSTNTDLYPNATALNQNLLNAYGQAQAAYNQNPITPSTDPTTGLSNINQLYGNAEANFSPFLNLGTSSANTLQDMSGANGSAAENTAVNAALNSPLIQNQLNLGDEAIQNSDASSGYLRSGQMLRDLQQNGMTLASNAVSQQQQNLLAQVGIGQSAAQNIGTLSNQQNAAQMNLANATAALPINQAKDVFAQQQAMTGQQLTQNQQAAQALESGIGAQQTNAQDLSQLTQAQQAAYQTATTTQYNQQIAEAHYNYETNAAAQQATSQSQTAANQNYLNYLLNLYMAQGRVGAQQAYGQGQYIGTTTY